MKNIFKVLMAGTTGAVAGVIAGVYYAAANSEKEIYKQREMSDKHLSLFILMDSWVDVKQRGNNLSEYFKKNNYKKIAVYGMSYAGERLIKELENTEIEVVYGIDRNAENIYSETPIYTLNDSLEKVDAVVVSSVYYFSEIKEELEQHFDCPIISLEDVVYES